MPGANPECGRALGQAFHGHANGLPAVPAAYGQIGGAAAGTAAADARVFPGAAVNT